MCTGCAQHNRREFVLHGCQVVSLAATAAWLDGCSNSPTSGGSAPSLSSMTATVVNRTITIAIDASSPLAAVGKAALVRTTSGDFLVAHTAQDTFTALTAVCTHEGCAVTGFDSAHYVCPCHGSTFTTSGAVVQGPASSPLHQFPTTLDAASSVVTISV